jgi:glutaminase
MLESAVDTYLAALFDECHAIDDGTVADYIPELGKADPSWFAIAIATTDGHVYEVGDTNRSFTIQSISKPFVYGAALDIHGVSGVLERVGVEPTGNAFNAIAVDEETRRPFNPMVNAGAIVTTGLMPGDDTADREDRLLATLSSFAGRDLDVDEAVYASERGTGDRNRAMAYLMRSFGMVDHVEQVLDLYFRQCSTLVTCRDLATMAATLACSGINPTTRERVLGETNVERVLSIMSSCGMYDYAGEWGYTVGLPAKSGVSGGILAVLPGQLGIAAFSPPLDRRGNSVRGIEVFTRISRDLELHTQRARPRAGSAIRRSYRGNDVRSLRVRPPADVSALTAHGERIAVFELQGDLLFASTEPVHRAIAAVSGECDLIVLDLQRVRTIDLPASRILRGIVLGFEGVGATVLLAHAAPSDPRLRPLVESTAVRCFETTDDALQWCEDVVLGDAPAVASAALTDQPLLRAIDPLVLTAIDATIERRRFEPGELVVHEGDTADAIYFVLSGAVGVHLPLDDGTTCRIASFGPGVSFGEAALLDERVRSADVRVEEPTELGVLTLGAIDAIVVDHPALRAQLFHNLAQMLAGRLQGANAQLRALAR